MISVWSFAVVVNAEETARFVLLMIELIVLIWPLTATFEPIVMMPFVLAILNLVPVPVTNMVPVKTLTKPEIVLLVISSTEIVTLASACLFKSA